MWFYCLFWSPTEHTYPQTPVIIHKHLGMWVSSILAIFFRFLSLLLMHRHHFHSLQTSHHPQLCVLFLITPCYSYDNPHTPHDEALQTLYLGGYRSVCLTVIQQGTNNERFKQYHPDPVLGSSLIQPAEICTSFSSCGMLCWCGYWSPCQEHTHIHTYTSLISVHCFWF